jgi:hypothetical protein
MIGFDTLLLTGSTLGKAVLSGADLVIPASNLFLLGSGSSQPVSGGLVFKDVARSVREIIEYIGDPRQPDGFKEPYVETVELAAADEETREYGFEGFQSDPAAWITWTVTAKDFEFIEDGKG